MRLRAGYLVGSILVISAQLLGAIAAPAVIGAVERSSVTTRPDTGPRTHLIGDEGVRGPAATRLRALVPDHYDTGITSGSNVPRLRGDARRVTPRSGAVGPAAAASPGYAALKQISQGSFGWGSPPDTILARGPDRTIEMVNRRIRLHNNAGSNLSTRNLNTFFGAVNASGQPTGQMLFDPKIIYDRNAARPRYYAVALQVGTSAARLSRIYVAISRTSRPTSLTSSQWCRYWINARTSLGAGTDTWADYPGLGIGRDGLVITTNQFGWDAPFVGSVVWALNKTPLNNNATSCPSMRAPWRWHSYTSGSFLSRLPFTMQPALHYTSPGSQTGVTNPVYMVNTLVGSPTYDVWRVANLATSDPLLWGPISVTGTWANESLPDYLSRNDGRGRVPNGAGGQIITGDPRMMQVSARGDRLTGVHAVGCQYTASTTVETCIRVIEFNVGTGSGNALVASVARQMVTGGGDDWHYFYPSVATNAGGVLVAAFDVVGLDGRLSSAWAILPVNASAFSQVTYLAQGTCALSATYQASILGNRAGDYNGASADPDGTRVWVAAERAVTISGIGCGWQTWVAAITP